MREQQQTIAVSATFTAEPLEQALNFWMQELDTPSHVTFAPHNQVFQQLLVPDSLLSTNERGLNVLLVRLEDWQGFEEDGDWTGAKENTERNVNDFAAALIGATRRNSVSIEPSRILGRRVTRPRPSAGRVPRPTLGCEA